VNLVELLRCKEIDEYCEYIDEQFSSTKGEALLTNEYMSAFRNTVCHGVIWYIVLHLVVL
jgi:hypothetical protein